MLVGCLWALCTLTAKFGLGWRCEVCWVAGRPADMRAWISEKHWH